jgi:carboxymethylenebutenolidase
MSHPSKDSLHPPLPLPIEKDWVTLIVEDPTQGSSLMECYWVKPEMKGKWPGVVLLMEIFGINDHMQQVAEKIASQGYSVLAINYYHRETVNLTLDYSEASVALGRSYKDKTRKDQFLLDLQEAMAFLKEQPDALINPITQGPVMGTVGFCFGGHLAYLSALLPEVSAAVSFYPGGIPVFCPGEKEPSLTLAPRLFPQKTGEMLLLFGEQDPLIPVDQIDAIEAELAKNNIPHQVLRYPQAGHGFCCDQRADYQAESCEDAWQKVFSFLSRRLQPTQ